MDGPRSALWGLPEAFDLRRKDIVAFVGGGGKTSAMFRLAAALAADNWRVITTTTTHLSRDESSLSPRHLSFDRPPDDIGELVPDLDAHRHLLVTGPPVEGGVRWGGVSPEWVARAAAHPQVNLVLVEADGARRRPFKAPAPHEPVVPPATTLLIPVVGVDALGGAIEDVAHRPEQVCALTGLGQKDKLTEEAIARVLMHPAGGLKGCPPTARVRVLVNKVESGGELLAARSIVHRLLGPLERVSAVVLGAMGTSHPIREVHRPVAAVVLAAGRSTRMGGETPKQLLPWDQVTVVRRIVDTLSRCPVSPLLVVTGHRGKEVGGELAGTRAQTIHNPDYRAGEMLSSLQVGIRALDETVRGCLVVLADQPWLEAETVERVLNAYASAPAGLVAPSFQGRRGHPVLIDRRHWDELLALGPGHAPRHLFRRHSADTLLVPVATDSVIRDLDTPDDYRQALGGQN